MPSPHATLKMNDLPVVSNAPSSRFVNGKKEISLDAILVVGGFLLICIIELLGILVLNDGKFTYTLDDTYIHLAVAEEIARGHYGINALEFSAPCSSPIWPFLIAPLARTPIGELLPLILNLGFGLLTCLVVLRGIRRVLPSVDGSNSLSLLLARATMSWVVLFGCNVVGLVFSGMEHNLQVLLAVLLVDGMIRLARTGKADGLFVMAAICGPLVRYENLALTAAACGVFFLKKRPTQGLLIGGAALLGLAAFSGFLSSLGLPLIPSSILAKSHLASDVSRFDGTLMALKLSLLSDRGVLLLLMTSVLVWLSLRPASRDTWPVAIGLVVAGLLHACFGAYGWYNRYECYIYAALLYGIFSLFADSADRIPERWTHPNTAVLALFGSVISFPYVSGLLTIPFAANNIYEQQFQMHRFATGWWKMPLAVNDLGWVSYQNDAYILDLWGLGSHEALKARMEGQDPTWMTKMADQHGVKLAMIYDAWMPARAIGWIKVGELRLSRPRITPADSVVTFFAISPSAVAEIETALVEFRKTLPPGVVVVIKSDLKNPAPSLIPTL